MMQENMGKTGRILWWLLTAPHLGSSTVTKWGFHYKTPRIFKARMRSKSVFVLHPSSPERE